MVLTHINLKTSHFDYNKYKYKNKTELKSFSFVFILIEAIISNFRVDILSRIGGLVFVLARVEIGSAAAAVELVALPLPPTIGDVWAVLRIVGDVVNSEGVACKGAATVSASNESSYSFS